MLRVARFLSRPATSLINGELVSGLASVRQRAIIPAALVKDFDIKFSFFRPEDNSYDLFNPHDFDIAIFDKVFRQATETTQLLVAKASSCQTASCKVVLDVCNNFFSADYATYNPEYVAGITALIDAIMVNALPTLEYMKTILPNKPLYLCPEGYEYQQYPVKKGLSTTNLQLLWFGNLPNLVQLVDWLPALKRLSQHLPLNLGILTGECPPKLLPHFNAARSENFSMTWMEWSFEKQVSVFSEYDLVLLPESRGDDSLRAGTRCIEALHAGCPVVTSPFSAYQEFYNYIAVVEGDPAAAIMECLNNPEQTYQRTLAGQQYVKAYYNPEVIAAQWAKALFEIAAL